MISSPRWFVSLLMFFIPLASAQAEEQAPTAHTDLSEHRLERQNHVAALVEWFEEQQAYLKYLDNMQGAVEKELNIVNLMYACQQKGAECTGQGIMAAASPPSSSQQQSSSSDAPADRQKTSDQKQVKSKPTPPRLPIVVAVYGDSALVEYQGRRLQVRSGDRLAGFRVRTVDLDRFELESASGLVRLPVYWPLTPPAAADEHGADF